MNAIIQTLNRLALIIRAVPRLSLRTQTLIALIAGALNVFAFAPFTAFPLVALCWGVLWILWQDATPHRAMWLGFVWAFGQFWTSTGWLYIAFHTFGGMSPPLTIILLSVFFSYFAVWAALAGWLYARLAKGQTNKFILIALGAACWTLGEWVRSCAHYCCRLGR